MKKVVFIMLCICIVLSGCFKSSEVERGDEQHDIEQLDEEQHGAEQRNNEQQGDEQHDKGERIIHSVDHYSDLRMVSDLFSYEAILDRKPLLKLPVYGANVMDYTIEEDFSNVANFEQFF